MRPIAIGPCPGPKAHDGHEVIVTGDPIGRDSHPRGLLTLWRCPVDGWGGFWHDFGRDPTNVGGGPSLDDLPR